MLVVLAVSVLMVAGTFTIYTYLGDSGWSRQH
jgi:hypothetical protein